MDRALPSEGRGCGFDSRQVRQKTPFTVGSLEKMKVISWNIRWGWGLDDRVDLDRIVKHLWQFSDFDVLCLQEVVAGYTDPGLKYTDGSDQFAALEKKLPGFAAVSGYAVDQLATSGARRRFGNMIFSRYPVLQIYRYRLPWPAEKGVITMPRMALEAVLDTPSGILRVITTHLEYYSSMQRMAQVGYLRQIYQETAAHVPITDLNRAGGPFHTYPQTIGTILAGDFNFTEVSAERELLLSPFDDDTPPFLDAWQIAHPGKKNVPTMGYFNPDRWPDGPFVADFMFVSENLAGKVKDIRVDQESSASDHQALLLILDM